jgi:hypothetical protein
MRFGEWQSWHPMTPTRYSPCFIKATVSVTLTFTASAAGFCCSMQEVSNIAWMMNRPKNKFMYFIFNV